MKFKIQYTENFHSNEIGSCRHTETTEIEANNFDLFDLIVTPSNGIPFSSVTFPFTACAKMEVVAIEKEQIKIISDKDSGWPFLSQVL